MLIKQTIKKLFSNKIVHFPPSLQKKNPIKQLQQKSNKGRVVQKGIQFSENNNEIRNEHEKAIYSNVIQMSLKKMLSLMLKETSHKGSSIQESVVQLNNLHEFKNNIKSLLVSEGIENLLLYIDECKNKLSENDFSKNEALLKILLDKISRLTNHEEINLQLIKSISSLNISQINISSISEDIYQNYITSELETDNDNKALMTLKLNEAMSFIKNNNKSQPENDFKDIFLLKNEMKFTEPLLIQSNPQETFFAFSNSVFYENFPLVYPLYNKKKELLLKNLTNEYVIKNGIDVRKGVKGFSKSFIQKSLASYFKCQVETPDIYISRNDFSNIGPVNTSLYEEAMEFVDNFYNKNLVNDKEYIEVLQNMSKNMNNKLNNISKIHKFNSNCMFENSNIMQMRLDDINTKIKESNITKYKQRGFVKFDTYDEKIRFLQSPMRIFGLNVLDERVYFHDSDFINLIEIRITKASFDEDGSGLDPSLYLKQRKNKNNRVISIQEVLNMINYQLKMKGNGSLLIIPSYKLESSVLNREIEVGKSVYIRTNSFKDTMSIFNSLYLPPLSHFISPKISSPKIKYYNDYFISSFDLMLLNSIENFENVLNVESDYVNNYRKEESV